MARVSQLWAENRRLSRSLQEARVRCAALHFAALRLLGRCGSKVAVGVAWPAG